MYVTSDLHADLRKFIQILERHNLILLPRENPYFYKDENIYNADLLNKVEWNTSDTLFVIVGDLVNGKRPEHGSIDDANGSFELLLHTFIFNLRIKANAKSSEILFVAGNHDLATVIANNSETMINDYVTDNAKHFFNAESKRDASVIDKNKERADCLLPFYMNSPFYYLSLMNGESREVVFVHGGLHSPVQESPGYFENFRDYLEDHQTRISNDVHHFLDDVLIYDLSQQTSPIWTRYYAEMMNESQCALINALDCKLLVVGHCVTHQFDNLETLMNDNPAEYDGCDRKSSEDYDKGCVIGHCRVNINGHQIPSLMFVDVGMSSAYYDSKNLDSLNHRDIEILKLIHSPESSSTHFYNIVERIDLFKNRHVYDIASGYRYEEADERIPLEKGSSSIKLSELLCDSVEIQNVLQKAKDATFTQLVTDRHVANKIDINESKVSHTAFADVLIPEMHFLPKASAEISSEDAPDFELEKIKNEVERTNVLIELNHYRIPFLQMQKAFLRMHTDTLISKLSNDAKLKLKEKMNIKPDAPDDIFKVKRSELVNVKKTMQNIINTLNVAKIYHKQLEEYDGGK